MIYLGAFISFSVPMIWSVIALDIAQNYENKFAEWVRHHPAATGWVAKICALIGSVLMAIGGVLKFGWFGVLLPVLYYLVFFLLYLIAKFIDKKRNEKRKTASPHKK